MGSHPVAPDVIFLVGPFVYFHTLCVQTAKALVRLRRCTGSPEPLLVTYMVRTIISWGGSNHERVSRKSAVYNLITNIIKYLYFYWTIYCKPLYFRILWFDTFSRKLKFAMHDAFLFKFYICKHFAKMLNSRGIKFANISKNKVLVNKNEFTVFCEFMSNILMKFCEDWKIMNFYQYISRKPFLLTDIDKLFFITITIQTAGKSEQTVQTLIRMLLQQHCLPFHRTQYCKTTWAATLQNQQNECAHSEDSDQTGRMPRLIWVFAGRTLILLVLSCRSSHCSILG